MSEDYKQGLVDALGELAWSLDAQGRKADSLTCTRAAIELAGTPQPEDALRLPLRNLMKESAAMLALCEPQLREAAGNTNVAVFLQRITEAAEAFEQHAPQPQPQGDDK